MQTETLTKRFRHDDYLLEVDVEGCNEVAINHERGCSFHVYPSQPRGWRF